MTSKSIAVILAWDGIGMCWPLWQIASVSHLGHGASTCARYQHDTRRTHNPSEVLTMTNAHAHKPHHSNSDVPDVPEEFEPGAPPVEPDEGPVPDHIPDDPEHDRVIDPGAIRA